ncbi:metallophosphoesterase [Paenibacillus aquistagni]|uniref:metallophosphoesterase n=1 Tax=Paenibacillus aquistagni TaxID=1852522 RepID=UPI001F112002|nr:metallophosphoesterase [Paenibacillus aquistagni]
MISVRNGNSMKRAKSSWASRMVMLLIVVLILMAGGYGYSTMIEPGLLDITRPVIVVKQLPESLDGLRIVQFSDTHIGEGYSLQQLDELIEKINEGRPDLVVFTGDLIDKFRLFTEGRERLPQSLAKIEARLGKFAVYGNHDRGGGASTYYRSCMEEAGFKLLVNESYPIEMPGERRLVISGLDDYLLGQPEEEAVWSSLEEKDYNVVLVHEPDAAAQWKTIHPLDLILAGHSHGGQVQLPFIGPLIVPPLAEKYVEGHYELESASRSRHLYVNRGIGTTRKKVRLGSKPELTVLTLRRTPA